MLREWLYSSITNSSEVSALLPGGLHQATHFRDVPAQKPFSVYRLGSSSASFNGDDRPKARVQPVQIFIHDHPGSYDRIDSIVKLLVDLLVGTYGEGIIRCEWVEEGPDLRDDDLNTIFRYLRLQIVH